MEEALVDIEKELKDDLLRISSLNEDELGRKLDNVKQMIAYYNTLTSSIEDRRQRILNAASNNVSIALASIALVLSIDVVGLNHLKAPLVIYCVTQLLGALCILIKGDCQSKYKYPFNDLEGYSNQWKWFYKANPFFNGIFKNGDKSKYLQGLKRFVENYNIENSESELKEAIVQLYLLQTHNGYKNRFYIELSEMKINVMKLSAVLLIVALIF